MGYRRTRLSRLDRSSVGTLTATALSALVIGINPLVGVVEAGASPAVEEMHAEATAQGVRISAGMPRFLVVEQVADGGGPVAEAVTGPLGSDAFASLPYPGDNGVRGPGTVAGVAGTPSPPDYPFYVASQYPGREEAAWRQPGWSLQSRAGETSSEAHATSGHADKSASMAHSLAQAKTQIDRSAGTATAFAAAEVAGLHIGNVLTVGRVASSAEARRTSGQGLDRRTVFTAEGLSIGGQAVTIGPNGIALAGQQAPLPDGSPLLEALKAQGVTISYVGAVEGADSITSAGLLITHEVTLPSGNDLRLSYHLGFARAEVAAVL
jgi:hypothetical protein